MVKPAKPPGPATWPGLDRISVRQIDPVRDSRFLASQFGDAVRYTVRGRTCFQFSHPDACHELLETRAGQFRWTSRLPSSLVPPLPCQRNVQHVMRPGDRLPTLNADELQTFVGSMARLARDSIRHGHVPIVNIRAMFSEISILSVAALVFGKEAERHSETIREAVRAITSAKSQSASPEKKWRRWTPGSRGVRRRSAWSTLRRLVHERIQYARQNAGTSHGWITRVVAMGESANVPTDDGVAALVLAVLLSGHHVTTTALTWSFYKLAPFTDVQHFIADEIGKIAGAGLVHLDGLYQPSGVQQILNEALRLYPPARVISREATEDSEIAGYAIPKHAVCIVPMELLHRDARWFASPDEFLPQRFNRQFGNELATRAFWPFGCEPLSGILRDLVMLGGAAAMATILQRYFIEPVNGFPEPEASPSWSWHPGNELYLQLHARSRAT